MSTAWRLYGITDLFPELVQPFSLTFLLPSLRR